jgi:hypothetical protein
MKVVTSLAFALAATLSASAFAADKAPADKLTPQQQKLSACAKDAHAKSLKGDEYKSYMSTCTKADATAGKTATTPAKKAAASTAKAPPTNMTAAGDVSSSTTSADKAQAADKKAAAKKGDAQWVAAPSGGGNAQQQKMKTCATDAKAKGLKGAERRTFMSTCLKGDGTTPAATTPPAQKSTT